MQTVAMEQVQSDLKGFIAGMKPGEEVVITESGQAVARLIVESIPHRKPRQPGSVIGKLFVIQEDITHLADFKEYMP